MNKRTHPPWERGAVLAFGILAALLLTVAPVEARFKIRLRSTPKSPSAPVVSRPHVPSPAPSVPKAQANKLEVGRVASAPQFSVASQDRGFFQRILDWILWRRPAPAPAVTPALASPVAAAPSPPAPPVVAAAPAPPSAPLLAPGTLAPVAPFPLRVPDTAGGQEKQPNAVQTLHTQRTPVIKGYILHLTNGRTIPVAHYEEKGGEVVIPQRAGSFGLSRSSITRIEEVRE